MRYLIIDKNPETGEQEACATKWYNADNYRPGMIVIDLYKSVITFDGKEWQEIEEDCL
jgi:hypothetical protein